MCLDGRLDDDDQPARDTAPDDVGPDFTTKVGGAPTPDEVSSPTRTPCGYRPFTEEEIERNAREGRRAYEAIHGRPSRTERRRRPLRTSVVMTVVVHGKDDVPVVPYRGRTDRMRWLPASWLGVRRHELHRGPRLPRAAYSGRARASRRRRSLVRAGPGRARPRRADDVEPDAAYGLRQIFTNARYAASSASRWASHFPQTATSRAISTSDSPPPQLGHSPSTHCGPSAGISRNRPAYRDGDVPPSEVEPENVSGAAA